MLSVTISRNEHLAYVDRALEQRTQRLRRVETYKTLAVCAAG